MDNKSVEQMAEEIFIYFEKYINHTCVAPTVLGNPTKNDLMFYMGGVTAGLMAGDKNYDNKKIREVCSSVIKKAVYKYESLAQ